MLLISLLKDIVGLLKSSIPQQLQEINSMFKSKTVLSQMQSLISGYDFKNAVSEYNGDKGVKVFSTKNLLSVMLYMHMASKQSLRDVIDSLESKRNLWYHLGLQSLSRNNLSAADSFPINMELSELLLKKPPPLIDTGRGDGIQLVLGF